MNALPQHPPAVRTTCAYCGVGCGVLARPDGHGGAEIAGDPAHPANFGRLCSKGSALGETLALGTRLLHPMARDGGGALLRTGWDEALTQLAAGFAGIVKRYGPDAVAFYLSGQLLTEDYYVANKLMKGFIGSSNVDTNSRLCMASSVAGHRRAFGSDTVPGCYADLDEADLIVLVGSNAAWCHPVLYQRMVANKRSRSARLVVIDPRRTATVEDDDLFLPVAPGQDAALFAGLFVHLAEGGAIDWRYVFSHTENFDDALARARAIAPDRAATARATGLSENAVAAFFTLFAATEKVVTCYSQGVNQSAQGTDKVGAIINCHLATGRIGMPGMGPFSLTGQPNAMGGREVGGLANQLAAHMDFTPDAIDRVGRFWRAPTMARKEGLKAVALFDAIERGEVKALWVMGTNPAVSMPDAARARDALKKLELFAVSENVASNDTVSAHPHIVLPAAAWGEKDGTVTNSERRISRQRAFLPLPGEARPDWWIVSQVAARMGFAEAFSYRTAADIFREHAALSAFENDGTRDFDIGALAALDDDSYNALDPLQWPLPAEGVSRARMFDDGRYYTADARARFAVIAPPALATTTSEDFPFRLNTGRIRDQWHTMTRTGLSPRLGAHLPEPFVEVHPDDAAAFGLDDHGFARLSTQRGSCILRVHLSAAQQRGSLFAPIHWSDSTASSARVGDLVEAVVDPVSGQPEAKATPAQVAPVSYAATGFALSPASLTLPAGTWWSRVALPGGVGYAIASNRPLGARRDEAGALFGDADDIAEYVDEPGGCLRLAAFAQGRLLGCLFLGRGPAAPSWDGVAPLLQRDALGERERRALLSGRAQDGPDPGPLVCACFGVGRNTIIEAVRGGACDAAAIGSRLRAGTNCGSCLPELRKIVSEAKRPSAAPA